MGCHDGTTQCRELSSPKVRKSPHPLARSARQARNDGKVELLATMGSPGYPKETAAKTGDVIIRRGQPEDIDPAIEVWRVSNTARRDGLSIPPEHDARVRGAARKPDAFLVVADDR